MYIYHLPNTPKMLQETLSVAETLMANSDDPRKQEHLRRLQDVMMECQRMRPIGLNGKHGELHQSQCGCDDPLTEIERRMEWYSIYPL